MNSKIWEKFYQLWEVTEHKTEYMHLIKILTNQHIELHITENYIKFLTVEDRLNNKLAPFQLF